MNKKREKSKNTIHRLIVYRKTLLKLKVTGERNIFSHKLAELTERTPAQVRRDLMLVGYFGTPVRGYEIESLIDSISAYIDSSYKQSVIIIGLGKLGMAILDYCVGKNKNVTLAASFDISKEKINKLFNGVPCYHINEMESFLLKNKVDVVILTVPDENDARMLAFRAVKFGVRGIINYSTARLVFPVDVYVENRDFMVAIEKAAFFSRVISEMESIPEAT